MAVLESGELKGKKIGATLAHHARRARQLPGGVAVRPSRSPCRRSPRSTSTRARPAARRPSGTRASRSSSARSAAPSRRTRSIATTGKVVELDLVTALRELPDDAARLADRAPQRAVPELPGGDGLRRRRASARTASSAARRRWSTTTRSRRRSARRACCRSASIAAACATTSAAGGAASGSRRAGWRARRSSTRSTASTFPYWTFDAQRRTARGTPRPATTTTSTSKAATARASRVTRQERRVRWEPASGVVDHFFDDEPVPGTQGLPTRSAAAGRAVSDAGARALRHRVSLGLRRRALPGGADRRRAAVDRADDAQLRELLRAADARRHVPQPRDRSAVLGPHVQARPGAGLAADLHLRRAQRSRCSSTATRARWPASIRTARGRCSSPSCSCCCRAAAACIRSHN